MTSKTAFIIVRDDVSEGVFGLGQLPVEDLIRILRIGDDYQIVLDAAVCRKH